MRKLAAACAGFLALMSNAGSRAQPQPAFDREFYFKMLGNRCLDFGGEAYWSIGSPVFVYTCNGSVAQRVRVRELGDGTHDVELRVRDLYCIGVRGRSRFIILAGQLELQACDKSPRQRFALDGDSILAGRQLSGRVTRDYAVQPQGGITNSRTPLAIAPREVSDLEYFRAYPVDGSDARPHSGFVFVSTEAELDSAIATGGWGSVIEIDPRAPFRIASNDSKFLKAGSTLRGYRKHAFQGPEVFRCSTSDAPAFRIWEEDVRMTGFQLTGPSKDRCPGYRDTEGDIPAIQAGQDQVPDQPLPSEPRAIVDHMEIRGWHGTALTVRGAGPSRDYKVDDDYKTDCEPVPLPRQVRTRAIGNFFHHVDLYGVNSDRGAYALAQGNVAYRIHNHVITSDGAKKSGYAAYDNLFVNPSGSQELDIHGTLHPTSWDAGLAGYYFDIGFNTALGRIKYYNGNTRPNFFLRGTPCLRVDLHDNIFRRARIFAIASNSLDPSRLVQSANIFGVTNALNDLAKGDFDGDGIEDMFVGSGAAWYFSSAGRAEWRFLNRQPEKSSSLRFGDFDSDGLTDVLALHNGRIEISWAGRSPFQPVNVTAWDLADLAVGDFDGDRRADLFLATGNQWFVAPGARNWAPYSSQAGRTPDLRFGDLNGDGLTDVVAQHDGRWQILTRAGGTEQWAPLHHSLSGSLAGVVVANLAGDLKMDLVRSKSGKWWVSASGAEAWHSVRSATIAPNYVISDLSRVPIGRFSDGNAIADVVFFSPVTGEHFDFAEGAHDPVKRLSRQPMR